MIKIGDYATIPDDEVWFEFSRSQGPGGQNVNKVSTQATLCFVVAQSRGLTPFQKNRIAQVLGNRINRAGLMRIACQTTRSQAQNRILASQRFAQLLTEALRPRARRVATRPTRAARERRLRAKQHRAKIKTNRRRPDSES